MGKERQASEGSFQANVCLGEPQPEPAGAGGPECKLRLRVCPAVIEGAGLPYSHTGQSLAEGCLERTSTPRHFQLCGHVGKATPEAKGHFRKRCLRYRTWEAKACISRWGEGGGGAQEKAQGDVGGVLSATRTHCSDAETKARGPRLLDLLSSGSQGCNLSLAPNPTRCPLS